MSERELVARAVCERLRILPDLPLPQVQGEAILKTWEVIASAFDLGRAYQVRVGILPHEEVKFKGTITDRRAVTDDDFAKPNS